MGHPPGKVQSPMANVLPLSKRVEVVSTRMVSMTQRHLVLLTFEVSMLSGDAPVVVSSQLLNRQDGVDEYHGQAAAGTGLADPRKAAAFIFLGVRWE